MEGKDKPDKDLAKKGSMERVSIFFKAVFQEVLLLGEETWVLPSQIQKNLGGKYQCFARRTTVIFPKSDREMGDWVYPPITGVLAEVALIPEADYVKRQQNTVVDYINT